MSQHEQNESSSWPARLLHVDTLTSYAWQPGDIYGGHKKPRYNAISYTWGRFALNDQEELEIKAAPIYGTTWAEFLPRMNPARYSVEDMILAIRTAACPYKEYWAVDFVWLDIACIDQTPNSPEMAQEIGRQAKIFRGAADCFVWLTTHRGSDMIGLVQRVDKLVAEVSPIQNGLRPDGAVDVWLEEASSLFGWFHSDEWFSSLWTLQEAFLSPKAAFMFKDGLSAEFFEASRDGAGKEGLFRLDMWVSICHWALAAIEPAFAGNSKTRELADSITSIGFLDGVKDQWGVKFMPDDLEYPDGYMGNPLGLLVASKHRTASREHDRIYGIMQIFGLQLGSSAPGVTTERFTLQDLEVQLAEAVLLQYPIPSQFVVHDEECVSPRSWMISSSVILPEEGYRICSHLSYGGRVEAVATLRTQMQSGTLWASFEGPLCSVEIFCHFTRDDASSYNSGYNRVSLDNRVERQMEEEIGSAPYFSSRDNLSWLADRPDSVYILFLGRLVPPESVRPDSNVNEFYHWGTGLLLQPQHSNGNQGYYARLGVISWNLAELKPRQPKLPEEIMGYFNGSSHEWINVKGCFG